MDDSRLRGTWAGRPLLLTLALLAACGGGEDNGTGMISPPAIPAPTPTPSPPAPPPFTAVIATLFADAALNADLLVTGKGWQFDYVPGPAPGNSSNAGDADGFAVRYSASSGTYDVTLPEAGSGQLYQVDKDYDGGGTTAAYYSAALRNGSHIEGVSLLARRPGTGTPPFKYVTTLEWFFDRTATAPTHRTNYGVIGLGQATGAADVPLVGVERLTGQMLAYMQENVGDSLAGKAAFEIDRATGRLEGSIEVSLVCGMGCAYPATTYRLISPVYSQGSRTFSAQLEGTDLPERGRISGSFAGPLGKEQLIKIELPFYDPNHKRWVKAGGVILSKTE